MRINATIRIASASALALLAACDSTSVDRKVVNVSFATLAGAAASAALDVTVDDGTNSIVITKAQIVVRKLELKSSDVTSCAAEEGDDNSSSDDCEEVKAGPMLVDLPLTAGATSELTASIPAGTYRELEFQIHKPTSTPADQAFVTANPNFAGASIRVEGTYNGTPFVFTSAMTDVFELEFDPPIALDADNKNVTIKVDLGTWFRNGTTVIDPATANPGQANETLVRNNIRSSFKSFEDDDHNGHDDDDDDH
ncbi:MAG TPA: hypothetical protein VKH19_08950 [Gemmatimonadaceae bacterium]|nr:hypothetical protein [Gemmatimonadaceae bacterium]